MLMNKESMQRDQQCIFQAFNEVFWNGKDNRVTHSLIYKACPESNDTKVLNKYNIFNLQKRHCEWIACT